MPVFSNVSVDVVSNRTANEILTNSTCLAAAPHLLDKTQLPPMDHDITLVTIFLP